MAKRSGSVVFADSKRTAGVAANLVVPHYTHDDKDWSIGGVMCVPLKAIVIAGNKFDLSTFPKVTDYGLVLGIDTGSEGFFVIDDTGGQGNPSVTETVAENDGPMGDGTGDYELIIGTKDGGEFTIRSPEQWRTGDNAEVIRRRPFRTGEPVGPQGGAASRSQMFMVGNAWLQAIAFTFCPRAGLVYFAHLDKNGQRAKGYLGPRSPPKAASAAALVASDLTGGVMPSNKLPPFWHDTGYLGVSLTEISYPVAAAPPGAPPPATDLELPITFMVSSGSADERVESTDPTRLSEPCLSATFPTVGGGTRKVTQVLDTGSGISIVMGGTATPKVSVSADDCPECGCVGTGGQPTDLASLFRAYNPGAALPKHCDDPPRNAQCGQGCCSQCCMGTVDVAGNPLSPQTKIRCAVSYCTGMLQYSPSFASADFSPTFKNIRVFLARGSPVCEPAVSSGLWGCWFWGNQEKTKGQGDKDDILQHSSTLPFYVLRAMQQETGEMANMTFKFWRSDLGVCGTPSPETTTSTPPSPSPPPSEPSSPPPSEPVSPTADDISPPPPPPMSDDSEGGSLSRKPRRGGSFTQKNAAETSLLEERRQTAGGAGVSWATVGLVMVVVCSLLFALAMLASLWRIGNAIH